MAWCLVFTPIKGLVLGIKGLVLGILRQLKVIVWLLCRSQQKVEDMKQVSSLVKESVWVEDKAITDCKGCNKPFSVSRRKVSG